MTLEATRDTAMTLIHWCNGFCFAGSLFFFRCVCRLYGFGASIRDVQMTGRSGGEKCGLLWVTGNRGDVGTRKDLKFGSGMMKRMAVKGRVGHGL